ncbi:nSTAND3 domain-containing NTPase [Labilibaculum euxinus]
MANYTFEDLLSPLDFEYLIKDLLSRDLGVELTAFAEGKDKGVDLRYSEDDKNNIVVQCKRVKSISKSMIEKECDNVRKLNPEKYYFATSNEPSVAKFDFIKTNFQDWMTSDNNIYTKSRLNKLLDIYPEIHQSNYKLWINSSEMFSAIINKPLFERAKSLINDLKRDYKFYVKNESLQQAIKILNKNQFIIISGIPGIGKTTLAKLILWEYLQKEYEVVEIRRIIEGEQLLEEDSNKKQVFYFDDFLGENFLKYDAIEGRSSDLIQLINRIMKNKHKALIMTTREYILKQAKEKYEKLDSNELDIYKYTLDLTNYGKRIRALILYNHLYYSGLSIDYIKVLIDSKAYKKIINHENYSPRIVEQMTLKLNNVSVEKYPDEFINNLNNPLGIWKRAFNSQISDGAKYTLHILLSVGEPVLLTEFQEIIISFHNTNTRKYNLEFRPLDIKNYLRELEDSFIKLNISTKGNHYLTFQNPSIKDFMLGLVKDNKELIIMILDSLLFFNQLSYTLNYLVDKLATDREVIFISNSIIQTKLDTIPTNTWLLSGEEYHITTSLMTKVKELKSFVKNSENKECLKSLIEKYKQVDISKLYSLDEKEYIKFTEEFKKIIKPDTALIFSKIVSNISWFENVSNFLSLRNIDSGKYDELLEINKESIKAKIESAIKKDIEITRNIHAVDNLSKKLSSAEENLHSKLSLDISYFDNELKAKRKQFENEIKQDVTEDLKINNIELDLIEDDFNEDEYFKIDLFR